MTASQAEQPAIPVLNRLQKEEFSHLASIAYAYARTYDGSRLKREKLEESILALSHFVAKTGTYPDQPEAIVLEEFARQVKSPAMGMLGRDQLENLSFFSLYLQESTELARPANFIKILQRAGIPLTHVPGPLLPDYGRIKGDDSKPKILPIMKALHRCGVALADMKFTMGQGDIIVTASNPRVHIQVGFSEIHGGPIYGVAKGELSADKWYANNDHEALLAHPKVYAFHPDKADIEATIYEIALQDEQTSKNALRFVDESDSNEAKPVAGSEDDVTLTSAQIRERMINYLRQRDGFVPEHLTEITAPAQIFGQKGLGRLLSAVGVSPRAVPAVELPSSNTSILPSGLFRPTLRPFEDPVPRHYKPYVALDPFLDSLMRTYIRYANKYGEFPGFITAHKPFRSEAISAADIQLILEVEQGDKVLVRDYALGPLDLVDAWIRDQAKKFMFAQGVKPDAESGQVEGFDITWKQIDEALRLRHPNKMTLDVLLSEDKAEAAKKLRAIRSDGLEDVSQTEGPEELDVPPDFVQTDEQVNLEADSENEETMKKFEGILAKPTLDIIVQILNDREVEEAALRSPLSTFMTLLDAVERLPDEGSKRAGFERFSESKICMILQQGSPLVSGYLERYRDDHAFARPANDGPGHLSLVQLDTATVVEPSSAPVVRVGAEEGAARPENTPVVTIYDGAREKRIVNELLEIAVRMKQFPAVNDSFGVDDIRLMQKHQQWLFKHHQMTLRAFFEGWICAEAEKHASVKFAAPTAASGKLDGYDVEWGFLEEILLNRKRSKLNLDLLFNPDAPDYDAKLKVLRAGDVAPPRATKEFSDKAADPANQDKLTALIAHLVEHKEFPRLRDGSSEIWRDWVNQMIAVYRREHHKANPTRESGWIAGYEERVSWEMIDDAIYSAGRSSKIRLDKYIEKNFAEITRREARASFTAAAVLDETKLVVVTLVSLDPQTVPAHAIP